MKPKITINMLGGLSVAAEGAVLLEESAKINKPWQVLCYLALNRGAVVPPTKLIGALWPEESLSDANNVLKNTIYALRREFKACEGEAAKPVLYQNGGYLLNPGVDFVIDVERFEALCAEAVNAEGEQQVALLQSATALYKGELLPALAEDIWVVPRGIYLRKLWGENLHLLCEALYRTGRYSELLAEATNANKIDPLQEDFYLHVFRALYKLEMYRVIVPIYQKTARLFDEELGITLHPEIREIYAAASEKMNPIQSDIHAIKDDLRELPVENAPSTAGGPLYCTYDVFKYLYQMVSRTAERTGARIFIVLVSLQEQDGGQPEAEALSEAMAFIRDALVAGLLRKSDTVARYSKSQYILMLSCEQASGAEPVVRRIRNHCKEFLEPKNMRLVFAITELDPLADSV